MRNQRLTPDKCQLQNQANNENNGNTHMHIHPGAKSKQSNKNKVQQIGPANKGNKKLYLPVKNKTK